MDWPATLAALALLAIATVAGGVAVRVSLLASSPASVATLLLVAVAVGAVAVAAAASRPRLTTPYWR